MKETLETLARSLGWEDPLEEEMATHSSVLAWEIPWTEEPGGLQSMGLQRAGHDWLSTRHIESNPPGCDRRGSVRQVKVDQCLVCGTWPPNPARDKACHGRRWTLAFFPPLTSTNSWLIQREWLTVPEAAGQLCERGVHGEASSTCYSFSLSLHVHRGP